LEFGITMMLMERLLTKKGINKLQTDYFLSL